MTDHSCPHCGNHLDIYSPRPGDSEAIQSRSTGTDAQEAKILAMLRRAGLRGVTSPELSQSGCVQYTARMFGLRARGFVVETFPYDGIGADGHFHKRLARYVLRSEPLPLDAKQEPEAACSN